jgi:hypothetical protein
MGRNSNCLIGLVFLLYRCFVAADDGSEAVGNVNRLMMVFFRLNPKYFPV